VQSIGRQKGLNELQKGERLMTKNPQEWLKQADYDIKTA